MPKQYKRVALKGNLAIVFEQIKELTAQNMLPSTDELTAEFQRNHRLGKDVKITPFWLAGKIDELEAGGYIGAAVKHVTGDGRQKQTILFYELTQGKRLEDEGIVGKSYLFPPAEIVARERRLLYEMRLVERTAGRWIELLAKER